MSAPRPRASIVGRATRYEVCAHIAGQRVGPVAFMQRVTRSTLLAFARQHADAIFPHLTEEELDGDWSYRAGALAVCPRVVIRATGRTERDAAGA
jgi:hypothetical protein